MKQYGLWQCVVDALLLAAVVCGLLKETRCTIMIAYTLNKVSLLVTHSMNMLVQIMQHAHGSQPHHFSQVVLPLCMCNDCMTVWQRYMSAETHVTLLAALI